MDLDFSAAQRDFREEVRTWLAEHKPVRPRPSDAAGIRAYDTGWQRTQYDGGWAGISWPKEYGGRGLSLLEQLIWYEEYGRAALSSMDSTFVGLNHAGPTLIQRATPEQRAAHLPPILRGDALWCQGFSEPEAGSDLASLRTRAVVDGDELVVSGQKIWTSSAFVADWQELLVRTDPSAPKHQGITWVICDMHSPGIDVRPIESMDRESEFCEVFYDEVRIPLSNVVGELNDGWRVGSIVKLYFSEVEKRVARLSMDVLGPDSLRFVSKWLPGGWTGDYLRSYASSIGGGTSQIQRNIIGERVLGLPR